MKATTLWEDGIYYAALKIKDSAQRRVFLDQACAGDGELRAAVEDMLASHAEAERFFTESSSALKLSAEALQSRNGGSALHGTAHIRLPEDEQIGARIGRYKLLQKIGEGGGGTVYRAEQEEPVRRTVALKIIKLGMDTKSVIARFGAERQALALMDHPNIARVFDAGATETGRPYFVMELVEGRKITDYCDERTLDTHHRLDLFIQICHAIQHAHQKGVIHRDIKPSNILVTLAGGMPVPKVIDFGIAKATTDQRLTDKTIFTACEQFMGTPAYMSPEQAQRNGVDIDTRSDIYSLGVLLYELLVGKTPFDPGKLLNSGVDELRRTLREQEPPRPSAMLTTMPPEELATVALGRRIEPARLIGLARGDLDWIVMKALEKERARRYETASELALDVQRYLHSEPVLACPPSRIYQWQKLVRRNQAAFAAGAAIIVILMAGLSASTWLLFKEKEAVNQAEQERAQERDQRRKLEARDNIRQAAILASQGKYVEANNLINRIPPSDFYPSLEAAAVFRSVGVWHAVNGRWKEAADQFNALLQVNVFENDKSDAATRDLLQAGPPLIESADRDRYENFRRQEAIRRFAGTTNPVAAERVIRASLLLPASEPVMRSLGPFADVVEQSLGGVSAGGMMSNAAAAWRPVSLALMEYRRGHWTHAAELCRRSVAWPTPNPARVATSRLILALCEQRLGQFSDARSELTQSGEPIEARFRDASNAGSESEGDWFDWAAARILLREARGVIGNVREPVVSAVDGG